MLRSSSLTTSLPLSLSPSLPLSLSPSLQCRKWREGSTKTKTKTTTMTNEAPRTPDTPRPKATTTSRIIFESAKKEEKLERRNRSTRRTFHVCTRGRGARRCDVAHDRSGWRLDIGERAWQWQQRERATAIAMPFRARLLRLSAKVRTGFYSLS